MKILVVLLMALLMCSCDDNERRGTAMNYKNSVVVDKAITRAAGTRLQLRYKVENGYQLIWLKVPRGEYDQFSINDTIK